MRVSVNPETAQKPAPQKTGGRGWLPALAIGAFLAVLVVPCVRVALHMNVPGNVSTSEWVFQDFRDAVYYPVVSLLNGDNPYDAREHLTRYPVRQPCSPYTPQFFLLHLPFGFLPHITSQLLYFGLTIGLTLVLALLTLRICGRLPQTVSVFLLATLILLSRPGNWNLLLGQTTLEFVLAVYVALWFGSRSPWTSGVALAIATMKPTFGVPLAFLMLNLRYFRSVAIGFCLSVVATLVPTVILVSSSGGVPPFLRSISSSFATVGTEVASSPVVSAFRLDLVAMASRLLGAPLGLIPEIGVFFLVLAIAGATLIRVQRVSGGPESDLFSFAVASLAILIASYQQPYSALLLVLPLTALVLDDWVPAEFVVGKGTRTTLIVLLSIPMVNYLVSWRVLDRFEVGSGMWLFLTSINGAALLAAFGMYVSLAFRTPSTAEVIAEHTSETHPDLHGTNIP